VNDETRKELLLRFLATAVPAEIHCVAAMRQRERLRHAAELTQYTADNGADILYYGIRQDADATKAAAMLATGLAMRALEVGGLTFLATTGAPGTTSDWRARRPPPGTRRSSRD
jgi:hypothetical protein